MIELSIKVVIFRHNDVAQATIAFLVCLLIQHVEESLLEFHGSIDAAENLAAFLLVVCLPVIVCNVETLCVTLLTLGRNLRLLK